MWARALAAGAAVVALGLVPWSGNPLHRLAGGEGDGPTPRFDAPLDGGALRELDPLPLGTRYVVSAGDQSPLVQGNAKAAGQLYLARGLPVLDPSTAELVVGVRGRRIVVEPRR